MQFNVLQTFAEVRRRLSISGRALCGWPRHMSRCLRQGFCKNGFSQCPTPTDCTQHQSRNPATASGRRASWCRARTSVPLTRIELVPPPPSSVVRRGVAPAAPLSAPWPYRCRGWRCHDGDCTLSDFSESRGARQNEEARLDSPFVLHV